MAALCALARARRCGKSEPGRVANAAFVHPQLAARAWPKECVCVSVGDRRTTVGASVLLCDEERENAALLAHELEELGHEVTVASSCTDAFSLACAHDFDVLVAAPFLRDGATLLLPRALGIRRPRLMVLMTRMSERLSQTAAARVGFDAQITRVVDARRLDRLIRSTAAAAAARLPSQCARLDGGASS